MKKQTEQRKICTDAYFLDLLEYCVRSGYRFKQWII